jgi:hypothetical protein
MSFSVDDISGMLTDYEKDHHTGMDIVEVSQLIYDYTYGYPVLVSTFCKYMDEYNVWSKEGLVNTNKALLIEKNPLFDPLYFKQLKLSGLCFYNSLYKKEY